MDGDDGRAVRTGSFELCDGEGRVRALLGLGPGGLVALDLADEAGRVRASRAGLGTWPNGATGVELLDDREHPRARFGAHAPGRESPEDRAAGTVTLDFWDRDGTYRAGLGGDGIDFYRAGDGHPLTHAP